MSSSLPVFPLGRLLSTPGALDALEKAGEGPKTYLRRHAVGDWGDVSADQMDANSALVGMAQGRAGDEPIVDDERIFSAYVLPVTNVRIWVITEADRSSTMILLPDEY